MYQAEKDFVPALRFSWLTRFYDPLVRLTTREFPFKRALIAQAGLQNQQLILDLACGTGTLSVAIKKRFPETNVVAIDADAEILIIAKKKAVRYQSEVRFLQAVSERLPFSDESFEQVFSTLSFHHLTTEIKIKTLREIRRVLKPAGEFQLADYGEPVKRSQKILSNIIRFIDGNETTRDNLNGRLGKLLEENGFARVEKTGHFNTMFGTIRLFRATK